MRDSWRKFLLGLLLVGCLPAAEEAGTDAAAMAVAGADGVLESGGLRLVPMPDSPRFEDARLSLDSIEPGAALAAGSVPFEFSVEGYDLGVQTEDAATKGIANSAQGQHIHLIVNNGPYSAHYEPRAELELSPGAYVALAFLSRSYHESVKVPQAAVVRAFTVGDELPLAFDESAPHLFYSRPKGSYKGADFERLMLDFYLLNAELSPSGYSVKATINGVEFLLTQWQPYVIEGLEEGTVDIELELLDAAGERVPGPFSSVSRSVTLTATASAN